MNVLIQMLNAKMTMELAKSVCVGVLTTVMLDSVHKVRSTAFIDKIILGYIDLSSMKSYSIVFDLDPNTNFITLIDLLFQYFIHIAYLAIEP